MNLALPALVVFVLLLPGFLARSRFKRIERSSLDFSPFGQVATEAVLWACGLHLIWIGFSTWFSGRPFQPEVVLHLLSSEPGHQSNAVAQVASEFRHIVAYFLTLFGGAYFLPAFARHAVTHFRLDRTGRRCSPIFRFHQAPWYYLLSGADFAKGNEPDFIAVSAIVDVAGKAFIFTGILDEYFVDSEGALDRLVLEDVMRRPLDADKTGGEDDNQTDRFYVVDGDYFVLRYSEVITLNVEYIKLKMAHPGLVHLPMSTVDA